jgi:hypothetical protein
VTLAEDLVDLVSRPYDVGFWDRQAQAFKVYEESIACGVTRCIDYVQTKAAAVGVLFNDFPGSSFHKRVSRASTVDPNIDTLLFYESNEIRDVQRSLVLSTP